MARTHYESDPESFPATAYRVKGWRGVAFHVLGWETEPDADTEWSGMENRTGRVVAVMVGDDRHHAIDPDDLAPLKGSEYCAGCGQIGCGCDVRDDE